MKEDINDNYNILLAIVQLDKADLFVGYQQLRSLLERICRKTMENENLQMTDMSARISFISAKFKLSTIEQNQLHSFRITSNDILNQRKEPEREKLLHDTKIIGRFIERISGTKMPETLLSLLPVTDNFYPVNKEKTKFTVRMRVCFQYADKQYLYVIRTDRPEPELLRVRYNVPNVNEEFSEICSFLWPHVQLNLIDIHINDEGILTPGFIVLEPDYLFSISSLADCYRDYGCHPTNYLLSRLSIPTNTRALLLGNITNLFLDEWIHAKEEVNYKGTMKKAFQTYPLEILACDELRDISKQRQFFDDCKKHFDHIGEIVTRTFRKSGYDLNKDDSVIEPSYFCEALGLQGRLDYMQRDMSAFIEMKSGKADEFSLPGKIIPKENNMAQMLLYQAVLEYSMGQIHQHVRPYLLYTRYPLLYPAHSSWKKVRQFINLRNQIVANEYEVQSRNDINFTAQVLSDITAKNLNGKKISGRYWELLRTDIDTFQRQLKILSPIEKDYFYYLYHFITAELYTSKCGDGNIHHEGRQGASTLWLSTLNEKKESGEILYDLRLEHNDGKRLKFHIADSPLIPNFRVGDAVILYLRNNVLDNVTNRQLLKASIECIDNETLQIVLRNPQRNPNILPSSSWYAIEHDVMDTSYNNMYTGLAKFLRANPSRRDLILTQRMPQTDTSFKDKISKATDDIDRSVQKALAANDFFLLMGPPGTGKTSHALKQMVEALYALPDKQILLMAYTNRAVDEICKAISRIELQPDYLRIGNEQSCDKTYQSHLLCNRMEKIANRREAMQALEHIRIIVGTVLTLSGKDEIFKLRHFDTAIVDEATQILEPQLLSVLCARNPDGENAIGKFILIGDYKQLPAVVQLTKEQSAIDNKLLKSIGLRNLDESLFERLYRFVTHAEVDLSNTYDILSRQGRMNPAVAAFPNEAFYGNKLKIIGLSHQCDQLKASKTLKSDELSPLMTQRVAFLPSKAETWENSSKTNHNEATIVAQLAQKVYEQYQSSFDVDHTLGIITPYRSQIALIKRKIAEMKIQPLNEITVDTVERFQGSERDVIIYSFCINHPYQLEFLSNLTEEDGILIDRKLNVALTRARKQLFLTGVKELLELNPIYERLLKDVSQNDSLSKKNLKINM